MSFKWDSPEMKRIIKGQIRRAFRRSPQFIQCMKSRRVEFPPLPKKDGTIGKKKVVKYQCEICQGLFPQKWVQVDHIKPAIPLDREEIDLSYDEMVEGICCDTNNLQVVCSTPIKDNQGIPSCHRDKTNKENFTRRYIKELKEQKKFNGLNEDLLEKIKLEYALFQFKTELKKVKKGKK